MSASIFLSLERGHIGASAHSEISTSTGNACMHVCASLQDRASVFALFTLYTSPTLAVSAPFPSVEETKKKKGIEFLFLSIDNSNN